MVLFDEVEKAHGDVFNILLQVPHRPCVFRGLVGEGAACTLTVYLIE